jgi:hypothetical protein
MRRRTRLVALVVVSIMVAGAAQAAIRASGPDCPANVRCASGRLRDGAAWTIQMPRRWNGRLLLFSHGYVPPDQPNPPAATAIDPVVGVAVASQPAMPYAWSVLGRIPGQAESVGMDDEHWQRLLDRRAADDVCFRTLRFQNDVKSPAARVARIKRELAPDETFDSIPSRDKGAHSVLTDATEIPKDPTTEARIREALDSVIATLKDRLGA